MRRKLVLSALLATAACASKPLVPPGTITEVPPTPSAQMPIVAANYALGPLDVLRIDVMQEPSLSFEKLPVGADGTIQLPMAGRIVAAGRTTDELAVDVSRRLRPYLVRPQVAINVVEFVSRTVSVTGAVTRAGIYPVANPIRLTEALALAQGANENAKLREVVVFRTVDEKRYAAHFDVAAIEAGQAADPEIQSGDIVVVGYSRARQLFRDVAAILPFAAGVFIQLLAR